MRFLLARDCVGALRFSSAKEKFSPGRANVIIRSSGDTPAAAATRVLTSFKKCEPPVSFDRPSDEKNRG